MMDIAQGVMESFDLYHMLVDGLTLPPELIFVARCFTMVIAVDIMCAVLGIIVACVNMSK